MKVFLNNKRVAYRTMHQILEMISFMDVNKKIDYSYKIIKKVIKGELNNIYLEKIKKEVCSEDY